MANAQKPSRRIRGVSRRAPALADRQMSGRNPKISDEELMTLLVAAGAPDLAPERAELLHKQLQHCLGEYKIYQHVGQQPSAWETVERLSSIEALARQLWKSLVPKKRPEEAFEGHGILSTDQDATLSGSIGKAISGWGECNQPEIYNSCLVENAFSDGGSYNSYPHDRMEGIINHLALLIDVLVRAKSDHRKRYILDKRRRKPDYAKYNLVTTVAVIYEEAFGKRPTDTVGGPWISFLRTVLCVAGLAESEVTDSALRSLWRSAREHHRKAAEQWELEQGKFQPPPAG